MWGIVDILFRLALSLGAIFLILLVLVQRGRGGGLAGALGGMGGSSAFGAKAGDTFTKITIVTSTIWILLCVAAVAYYGGGKSPAKLNPNTGPGGGVTAPADGAASTDAGDASEDGAE